MQSAGNGAIIGTVMTPLRFLTPVFTFAVIGLSLSPLLAQEEKEAATPAAETENSSLPKVSASDEAAVRALLGKEAIITGKVTNAHESSKAGMTFLTLDGGKFTVVSWKSSYDKFEGGSPARLYNRKMVEVTGTIEEYKGKSGNDSGKLQIKLNSPAQVKITGDVVEKEKPKSGGTDKGKSAKKDSKEEKPGDKKEKAPATPKEEKDAAEKKPAADGARVDAGKFFKE